MHSQYNNKYKLTHSERMFIISVTDWQFTIIVRYTLKTTKLPFTFKKARARRQQPLRPIVWDDCDVTITVNSYKTIGNLLRCYVKSTNLVAILKMAAILDRKRRSR